ncbi:acetyltransferase, partial [Staphylococcus aureus]
MNVLSLGSSSGVVWGRVPITAPAGAATGVTSRADAHSQMRRYAQT